jgi:hypothetical protein
MDSFNWNDAFNIAFALVSMVGGFILRTLWDAVTRMREDLAELERNLPATYARRDDVRQMTEALVARLERLEEKIDRLVIRQ